jgi:hypothetical protein
LRRAGASVLARLSGIPYEGLRELSTTHPFWRKPFVVPGGIEAISVVGAPLRCHVSRYVQRRFERLAPLGPNDGTCLLAEAFLSPGVVYPVWGADHFIRSPALSPLLYRLFRYVKSR